MGAQHGRGLTGSQAQRGLDLDPINVLSADGTYMGQLGYRSSGESRNLARSLFNGLQRRARCSNLQLRLLDVLRRKFK